MNNSSGHDSQQQPEQTSAAQGVVDNIISENQSLEQVNTALVNKVQQLEFKNGLLTQTIGEKDLQLASNAEALNKAEQIIRKLNAEVQNAERSIDYSERQMKVLKEQYRNLQLNYDRQEKDINERGRNYLAGDTVKQELKEMVDKCNQMRRENILNMDIQKEKYQKLLHEHEDLQRESTGLRLSLEAKEQECMTIQSHNAIQTQQVNILQSEIASMIEKLESIKDTYETELEQKDVQLQNTRNMALQQLRQMQQTMRQDTVNNQKEIMKLKSELKVKIQRKDEYLSNTERRKKQGTSVKQKGSVGSSAGNTTRSLSRDSNSSDSSRIIDDTAVNSPLISWLKQQLQSSWLREKSLKDCIQTYSDRHLGKIVAQFEDLQKQHAKIRGEVETWQMRNEEMETRLHNSSKRLWSLKQICLEQQKQLKKQTVERSAMHKQLEAFRHITEENVLECKNHYYDIYDSLRSSENYNKIYSHMAETKQNIMEADQDRAKLIKQLEKQCDISAQFRDDVTELKTTQARLEKENEILVKEVNTQKDKFLKMQLDIFDRIDPQTSKNLINPTVEQLAKLIDGKLGIFESRSATDQNFINELQAQIQTDKQNQANLMNSYEQDLHECRSTITKLEVDNKILSQANSPARMDRRMQEDYEAEIAQLRQELSEKAYALDELIEKFNQLQENSNTNVYTQESVPQDSSSVENNASLRHMDVYPTLNPNQSYGGHMPSNSMNFRGNINNRSESMDYPQRPNSSAMKVHNNTTKSFNQFAQEHPNNGAALNIIDEQSQKSVYELQQEHARKKEQQVVIQSIKEDIVDAVNDLKSKKDIWNLSEKQQGKCDVLIKKMIFNAREADYVAHLYDLMRGLFDVLREVMKETSVKQTRQSQDIKAAKQDRSEGEAKIIKNLEIIKDVFKKGAEQMEKLGEREWREVIDQQIYVLEETVAMHDNFNKYGNNSKQYQQSQTNFSHCLTDFKFCLNKVADSVVSNDGHHQDAPSSYNPFKTLISDSDYKKQIKAVLSNPNFTEKSLQQIQKYLPLNQKNLGSILEQKQLCNKILKSLREEVAASQTFYVKRVNADLIEFEQSQRLQTEQMRKMPSEEIIKIVGQLREEILSLRLNEIFMKKCGEQIRAIIHTMECCRYASYDQLMQNQDSKKMLQTLEDLLDSISREVKGCFQIETKNLSVIRNEFSMNILTLLNAKLQDIKMVNSLSEKIYQE